LRPKTGDNNPYYDKYIGLVGDDDIIEVLEEQGNTSEKFLKTFTEEQGDLSRMIMLPKVILIKDLSLV
jgi:hypothetical protein